MLQTFLPLFLMTFGICLFIVLMQFLWRYIDDMVGKGLGIPVLAEMFMYAALFLVPMALPLAILLASLMTFGNLGERLELLAMKSAGVSLIHIMRPLIVTLLFVSVGAFLLPELCHACRTGQTLHAALVYAPEITGIGYSGRFILQRYSRIQRICEEKGPEGRFIKRRDDL